MGFVFNGREFAAKIETGLSTGFLKTGRKPKMVTVCNPQDPASRMYSKIKAAKAIELGVTFEQFDINSTTDPEGLVSNINKDRGVDGFMIQLPLTGDKAQDAKLCQLIDPAKDADGLNPASGIEQATVRAVLAIFEESQKIPDYPAIGKLQIEVVGGSGIVGRGVVRQLEKNGKFAVSVMDRYGFSPERLLAADVIISATGKESLIRPEYVKEGVIAIDVGYPHGDFDPTVVSKAAFFTPVPGGVGPVTVAMLFANLLDLIEKRK